MSARALVILFIFLATLVLGDCGGPVASGTCMTNYTGLCAPYVCLFIFPSSQTNLRFTDWQFHILQCLLTLHW